MGQSNMRAMVRRAAVDNSSHTPELPSDRGLVPRIAQILTACKQAVLLSIKLGQAGNEGVTFQSLYPLRLILGKRHDWGTYGLLGRGVENLLRDKSSHTDTPPSTSQLYWCLREEKQMFAREHAMCKRKNRKHTKIAEPSPKSHLVPQWKAALQ